jgi:hypothetical protein
VEAAVTHARPDPSKLPGEHSLLLIPETVEELDGLERSRLYLTALGCPMELWEMLLLTQSGAWDPRRRAAPSPEGTAQTPAHALRRLRDSEGPFVRDVRFFLERIAAPADIARGEIVIGALTASRRNRAAVLRWIADPARYRPEAERRIASLSWRVGRLIEQLDRRRAAAWESSVRDERPAPRESAPRPAASVFSGSVPPLHPSVLADLRRAHRGSTLLHEHLYHRVEPWEFVLMLSIEGDRVRSKLDSLLAGEHSGEWAQLEELALGLVGRGVGVRREWGARMKELERYLEGLCGVQGAVLTVALEILLAAPAGRRRANAWLESPIDRASEAASYMTAVIAIARRYAADLMPETVVVVTSSRAA